MVEHYNVSIISSYLETAFRVLSKQGKGSVVGVRPAPRVVNHVALAARTLVLRRDWWVVQETHRRGVVAVALEHARMAC